MSNGVFAEVKDLLKLAVPAAATMAANLAMQIVDTMFVGRLGAAPLGGVSVGNSVFSTFMVVGLGFTLGLDYLVSHAYGAGKHRDCNVFLVQALYLAGAFALVFTILMEAGAGSFEALGVTPAAAEQGRAYLRTLSLSLLPMLLSIAFVRYLQATGSAMAILWTYVAANLVNAFGDWALIYGHFGMPALGVAGSGLATTIARTFVLVALVGYAWHRDHRLGFGLRQTELKFSWKDARELVRLGVTASGQLLLEVGVFATATFLVGRLGSVPLAGHHVVLTIASFTFMVPLGISSAGAVRVGQRLGAGQPNRAAHVGWTAILFALAFMATTATCMIVFYSPLLRSFTNDDSVVSLARGLLFIAALFQLSDGAQVAATGVLRGAGDTKTSMWANFAGHWLLGLPVGYLLCFRVGWGARGLWTGLSLGLTAVAAALLIAWRRQARKLVETRA
jgi:MATE family multidrug resistance protein